MYSSMAFDCGIGKLDLCTRKALQLIFGLKTGQTLNSLMCLMFNFRVREGPQEHLEDVAHL